MNNESYVRKWLKGSLSDKEKAVFERTPDFKTLEKLVSSTQSFKAPEYNIDAELEKLQLQKTDKGKVVKISWAKSFVRVAAVLVLIMASIFYFYLNVNTSIETLTAEKNSLLLPDSSSIDLNASTSISYKKRLWNITRQVDLDGEAFFSVAKGSKFDVETTSGTVSVLGTQFNVKNRENYFEVVCYEGLVEVISRSESEKLQPGHSFRVINGVLNKSTNGKEISPSWINNESSFSSIPFKQVIQEFEIQYGVKVTARDVNIDQLFTGKFIHNDQKLALQSISIPLNLKYTLTEENQIILSGKGD